MSEKKKPARNFMGREYEFGALFDCLRDFRPGLLIVGLSVGAAETRASRCFRCGEKVALAGALKLSSEGESLPTLIGYQSGQPLVGSAARNTSDVISDFWVPPAYWDAPCTSTHSYGDVMKDFASGLWKNAAGYDEELRAAVSEGQALIAISCPLSPEWTGKEESERLAGLVRSATGCSNVVVLPEPNAALMDSLLADEECAEPLGLEPRSLPAGGASPAELAGGLCKLCFRIGEVSGQLAAAWKDSVKPCIVRESKSLINELAESIYFQTMRAVRDTVRLLVSDGKPHKRKRIVGAAFAAINRKQLIGDAFDAVMNNSLNTHVSICRAETIKQLGPLSPMLYGVPLPEDEQHGEDGEQTFSDVQAPITHYDFYDQIQAAVCHSMISSFTYGFLSALIFVGTLGTWQALMGDSYSNVKHGYNEEDDELSPKMCLKVLSNLEKPSARHKKKTVAAIAGKLIEDEDIASFFPQSMYEFWEVSTGRLLLLITEEGR